MNKIAQKISNFRNKLKYKKFYNKYSNYTMIRKERFIDNVLLVNGILRDPYLKDGAIVECGVWRGGMSAALMDAGGEERDYYFFDSFEGLPPAKEIDGDTAIQWQEDTESPKFYDNCSASLQEFTEFINSFDFPAEKVHIIKGFFEESLPSVKPFPIAVLRLDGDWYDSTMQCLVKFWPHVLKGGIIILDDYYTWDGCTRALHDFLSKEKAAERISSTHIGTCFLVKR